MKAQVLVMRLRGISSCLRMVLQNFVLLVDFSVSKQVTQLV